MDTTPFELLSADMLSRSVYLMESHGFDQRAWCREDTVALIKLGANHRIPVLGGDLYRNTPKGLEFAYAGWYSNRRDAESLDDFIERSRAEAVRYVRNIQTARLADPWFVVVFDR